MFTKFAAWGFQYPAAFLQLCSNYVVYFFFFLLVFLLSIIILFLQGKGDLGIAGSWQGSQMIFGGSGGQDFVGKAVWVLGFLFMILGLYLAKAEVQSKFQSVLVRYAPQVNRASSEPQSLPEESVSQETMPQEAAESSSSSDK